MAYHLTKTTRRPFDQAIATVKGALADQGFGVLTEIDVRSTLANKLGVDPIASMQAIDNPALADIARQVRDRLAKVVDAV
jgi:uncharacterized protein (DUF302 family)